MNPLQMKLLDMLSWFHDFCVANNLRYYALGGTMLGTARHQGFIPWDDDIDVGMPRKDYEKLIHLLANKSVGKYVLETPDTNEKDYYYPFLKLYDTTTTLIENTKYQIKRGVYLDIFPLDGIGDTFEEAQVNFAKVKRIYNLLITRVTGFRKGRKWYKNLAVVVARVIPNFILDNKKILKKLVGECQKYDYDKCAWCGNLVGAWGMKEVMPKEFMGSPTLYPFENIQIYGVEKADEYLTSLYGDWRKLPPVEKQKSHHDFVLFDLEKSYLDK